MKNLKDLSIEERTLVTIGCEPFYIGFTQDNKLKPVFNELSQYLPINHKKELWVFITAATNPVKNNLTGSIFSLRKGDYTKANSINGSKISYVKCKRVVEKMDELGFITLYKGFYDHNESTSLKSCFVLEDKLIRLFDKVNIEKVGRPLPVETYVELKDSKTDEIITELSKLRGIKSKRELVKKYNELLRKFDIRCKSYRVCAAYKRVFTDFWDLHGRWYALGSFQTTNSNLRPFITINGVKTTEVDFKQMHPRILMEIDGISKPMSWEPYDDISDITGGCKKEARLLSKFAMMCLLNCENINKAKGALRKFIREDSYKENRSISSLKIPKGGINEVFRRLTCKNKDIAHWFGKEKLWAILQHYDSEIAAYIIEKFINLGKCILPWHDSFVVQVGDRKLLIDTMREAWKSVLGSNKNCFYDVEF